MKLCQLYGSYDHWPHGANFVVSVLHDHLSTLKEQIEPSKWPHTLYLQVDNCWRENKNTTMLCYLGLLIQFGWFKNIDMYSLAPGHTHEDIDQMFSTWHQHYWHKGLQSPLAILDFIKRAYPNVSTCPTFKMVQYCYEIKSWIKNFGVSLKGHSSFRAFHLQYDLQASNISLFYKLNSLSPNWIGSAENNSVGILLFSFLPDVNDSPEECAIKELDCKIISTFMSNSGIVENLDTANKEYYLILQTNSIFYINQQATFPFFSLGTYIHIAHEIAVLPNDVNLMITVDDVQQHLLCFGIVDQDIGSLVILDLACGTQSFTLAEVVSVQDITFKIIPYVQQNFDLNKEWTKLPSLASSVSKSKVLAKRVTLTKHGILKKRWKSFLQQKLQL